MLYRSTLESGKSGFHIRSFFPIFLGAGLDIGDDTEVVPVELPEERNGPVLLARCLPNPVGPDRPGEEWVELKNVSALTVDLSGWELRDRLARPEPLEGELGSGETRRVPISRSHASSLQLANKGGVITLHDAEGGLIDHSAYGRVGEGVELDLLPAEA